MLSRTGRCRRRPFQLDVGLVSSPARVFQVRFWPRVDNGGEMRTLASWATFFVYVFSCFTTALQSCICSSPKLVSTVGSDKWTRGLTAAWSAFTEPIIGGSAGEVSEASETLMLVESWR